MSSALVRVVVVSARRQRQPVAAVPVLLLLHRQQRRLQRTTTAVSGWTATTITTHTAPRCCYISSSSSSIVDPTTTAASLRILPARRFGVDHSSDRVGAPYVASNSSSCSSSSWSRVVAESNSSSSSSEDDTAIAAATSAARDLLEEGRYPLGSYTLELHEKAENVLDLIKKRNKYGIEGGADVVNLSFDLLERLVREMAITSSSSSKDGGAVVRYKWITPKYFNPLFNRWKEFALQGEPVISARDLVQKLQTMSTLLPEFTYDIATIGMIMHVVIKQAHPSKAPLVAEGLLEFVRNEAAAVTQKPKHLHLAPDAVTYGLILNAWAASMLPEAPHRMEALMDDMRSRGIAPNIVSYNILLRFWGGKGNVNKIEATVETLTNEGLELDLTGMSQIVYCYAKVGQVEKGEEVLRRMIDKRQVGDDHDDKAIAESVQNIMFFYRDAATSLGTYSKEKRNHFLNCAEILVQKMKQSLDVDSYGTPTCWSLFAMCARDCLKEKTRADTDFRF
jgi:pentatricopeptide repeat protein